MTEEQGNTSIAPTFSKRDYKCNSKLQATFDGTVETTGTETKTGFCITKSPYKEIFWHFLTVKPAVRSSWNTNTTEILCLF